MKIFDFLNEIDWTKNIIFLLVYISVIIVCVYFYLIPTIDSYKAQMLDYKKALNLENQIKQNLTQASQDRENVIDGNLHIFSNFRNKLNIETINKIANQYFFNVKIQNLGTEDKPSNELEITTIRINANSKNTNNIIKFLNSLSSLEYSIRIAFPIKINKSDYGDLDIALSLMFYNSTHELEMQDIDKIKAMENKNPTNNPNKQDSKAQSNTTTLNP
ncbi:MAG: hypothetical protein K2P17_02280 [Helicobacteraceae bacterium]|nr:hypothetical protein [Helicobacteraceae bacterium]